jgi:hypothetical protein
VVVRDTPARLALLDVSIDDLKEAGNIEALDVAEASEFTVETLLAPPAPAVRE